MKYVGIRFLLNQGGTFLDTILSEQEARQIVNDWSSGQMALQKTSKLNGTQPNGVMWAVKVDSISAIHTILLDTVQQQNQGWNTTNFSGRN